jgi:acyl-CoA synthetase (AMP-forming)/AMP-acid ligase II
MSTFNLSVMIIAIFSSWLYLMYVGARQLNMKNIKLKKIDRRTLYYQHLPWVAAALTFWICLAVVIIIQPAYRPSSIWLIFALCGLVGLMVQRYIQRHALVKKWVKPLDKHSYLPLGYVMVRCIERDGHRFYASHYNEGQEYSDLSFRDQRSGKGDWIIDKGDSLEVLEPDTQEVIIVYNRHGCAKLEHHRGFVPNDHHPAIS